jgi:hypothetical protein
VSDLILPLLAVALAVAATLLAARAYVTSRASVPSKVIGALEGLSNRVKGAEENLATHDARALAWRTEIDGLIEAAEDVLDRVERKRRRTQAVETRIRAKEGDGPLPDSDAALRERARAQGLF